MPGFGLRVSSSGARTWILMARVLREGRPTQIRVNLGRGAVAPDDSGALSLMDARAKARDTLQVIAAGGDPQTVKRQEHAQRVDESKNTFGAMKKAFLTEHCSKRRPATYQHYASILNGEDCTEWDERPITTIARADVRAVLEQIQARGCHARANRALAAVRTMMNWALSKDHVELNPTAGIKSPYEERERDRHLFGDSQRGRPSEIALAWQAFDRLGGREGTFLKTLLLTGQRRDEVGEMGRHELLEIDGDNARWYLPPERTKNGREHLFPLGPMAVACVKSMPNFGANAPVFTLNGEKPMNGFTKLKLRAETAIEELKGPEHRGQFVEPWVMHDLRRTFITGLQELGVDVEVRELLVNHVWGESRKGVRRHYNHARRWADCRAAVLLWERHIQSLIEPANATIGLRAAA